MCPHPQDRPPNPATGEFLRTSDLKRWDTNPNRFVKAWEAEGFIRKFGPGLWFVQGQPGRLAAGPVLEAWLKAYLRGTRFAVTGPMKWNQLPLSYKDSNPKAPDAMVYNLSRTESGIEFDNKLIAFSRRTFPDHPTQEWLVVDLMEHGKDYGWSWNQDLEDRLKDALRAFKLSKVGLIEAARQYGTRQVRQRLEAILNAPLGRRLPTLAGLTITQM